MFSELPLFSALYNFVSLVLPVACGSLLVVIGWTYISNHSPYLGKTYVKVNVDGYDAPYDLITVNADNTITIYYQNTLNTAPYQSIDKQSFSFKLPTDGQIYTAQAIITDNGGLIARSDVIVISNASGFKQVLAKNSNTGALSPANYSGFIETK